ncbi:MAG: hypothetical protein K2Q14_04225 [Gammaproteobacteria bacterium]|nr:hypothetical protein [Nitrosomonas sp.]MBY0544737.1 hypothetical protein [Gammaproteobacteria bacterium]
MKNFLESIGVKIPEGAVSYNTEGSNKIIFLIGQTGKFVESNLTQDQANEMKKGGCFGSFGWEI